VRRDGEGAQLSTLDLGERVGEVGESEVDRAAEDVGDCLRQALVRHVHEIDLAHGAQHRLRHLRARRAVPRGELPRIRFRVRQELLEVLRREVGANHDHEGDGSQARDRREVLHRVVVELLEQAHVRGLRRVGRHHDGVAVWSGARNLGRRDRALRAGLVLDHERLAERFLELLPHHARDLVGGASRGEWNDQLHRAGGIGLREGGRGGKRDPEEEDSFHRNLFRR
jgi:hypothetical protein